MRKTNKDGNRDGLAVLTACLVFALAWPSLCFGGQPQGHSLAFKVGAGMIYHTAQDFDTGFMYQAGFYALVSRRLGFDVLVAGNRVHMNEPPAGLSAGKLGTTQVLISGQYRFLPGKRIEPYAIVGVEFNFYKPWPEDESEEYKNDVVDRFAPHLGAGLDWALSDTLSLNADVKYSIIKTWVEDLPREGPINEVDPDYVDKIDLGTLSLVVGLKFYF
jgi:opacity protein-like surface antigen